MKPYFRDALRFIQASKQVTESQNEKSLVGNPSQNTVQPQGTGNNWVPLIVGLSAVALILIIAGSALFICYKLRRSDNIRDNDVHLSTYNQGPEQQSVKFVQRPASTNSAARQAHRDVLQKQWDEAPAFDVKLEEIRDQWDKDDLATGVDVDHPRPQQFSAEGYVGGVLPGVQRNQSIRKKKDRQAERIAINADNPFGSINNPPTPSSQGSQYRGRVPHVVVKVKKIDFGDYEHSQQSHRSHVSHQSRQQSQHDSDNSQKMNGNRIKIEKENVDKTDEDDSLLLSARSPNSRQKSRFRPPQNKGSSTNLELPDGTPMSIRNRNKGSEQDTHKSTTKSLFNGRHKQVGGEGGFSNAVQISNF